MENQPVLVASATITTTTTYEFDMLGARGLLLMLDITATAGTPTLDVKVQRVSPSGTAIDLSGAALAQKTGTGSDDLIVYPGVAETANRSVSDHPGRSIKIVCTVGGSTPSFTFTLGAIRLA